MPMLFKYRQKVKDETEQVENEVSQEYKSGVMDPSRDVAKFEKTRRAVNKIKKSAKYEDINKQRLEQKNIQTGINYLSIV